MRRTIRDTALETRAARGRLKARGKPYYRSMEPGLHLGYRKALSGAGKWIARHYVGDQAYQVEVIGIADDFSDSDGVRVLSYKQAQTLARERATARAHHAAGKHGPLTVADAMEAYFEFLEAHRKTARDAQVRAQASILPVLGDLEVAALTSERIRKWHLDLAKTPARHAQRDDGDGQRRRRSTANRMLTSLKAALNLAWREGRTPSDAAWRRVMPFKGVDSARVRYLEVAQCKRLINGCADDDFRRLVEAALATGCRYGELSRLQVADFSPDGGTIAIRQSKTGKARHVVLNDEGVALFRQCCAGKPGGALVFTHDGMAWGKSHQELRMRAACEHARISPPVNFHGLRHTWASHSVMNRMPLLVVAKNLGHSSTRMVEQHYSHLAPSYVADEIRRSAPKFGFKASRKIVSI